MKKLRNKKKKFNDFIREDIWSLNMESISKAKARAIKYLKVLLITIKTFSNEKIGFQAVALSFFCTMSAVPLVAIIIAVTSSIGMTEVLRDFIYSSFQNSQSTIDVIWGFAQNIIHTAQSSTMGLISALFFIWIVFWMMMSVERVFNNVWKVQKSRKLIKRFSYYVAILLVMPFIIITFFGGSIVYSHILDFIGLDIQESGIWTSIMTWAVFGVIVILTFSAMYKFIPNAEVKYKHALRAAMLAGPVFTIIQYLYLETQVFVTRLDAIYGAFAAIPLFMIWLNVGWFVILIGAEVSYAFQNVDNYNIED